MGYYDDEIEYNFDAFASNNNINIKNLNVREENVKRIYNIKKTKLKRIIVTGIIIVGLFIGTHFGFSNYMNISVPAEFDYRGVIVNSERDLKEFDDNFALIRLKNWKKGLDTKSINNINYCEENNIPYGVIVETDAKNKKEAVADAACVDAILDDKQPQYPIYYDVTTICNTSDNVNEIAGAFTGELSDSYDVGIYVGEDYLKENDCFNEEKIIICDNKEISYAGEYNMCYFSRTGECYSNYQNVKQQVVEGKKETSVEQENYLKGIDVSEYQGDIDWLKVEREGIDFAIIRFSSYYKYHDGNELKIDDKFYENVAACERLDIPYGIYCFSTATTEAEAKEEALVMLQELDKQNIDPELPIYYDAELDFHFNNPDITAKLAKTFCAEVEKNGHKAGLYASYFLIKDMIYKDPTIKDMNKWVARYKDDIQRDYQDVSEKQMTDVSDIGNFSAVQVTSKAYIDGIDNGNSVDVNLASKDFVKIF